MKVTDKVMLAGLHAEHQLISELAVRTRQKYRKLMKQIAKEDELTQHLKSSFSENIDTLKRELETWLGFMKVDEEVDLISALSFFVCNAKRRQSRIRAKRGRGSVERPLTDNCLYDYFGSGSERK